MGKRDFNSNFKNEKKGKKKKTGLYEAHMKIKIQRKRQGKRLSSLCLFPFSNLLEALCQERGKSFAFWDYLKLFFQWTNVLLQ